MKQIPLTQGRFALVDDDDYDRLVQFKWCANNAYKDLWYAVRSGRVKGETVEKYMHREILLTPREMETDHIDGDGLNNQKSNLRIVTVRGNAQNRHITKSSNLAGASYHKGKWRATARINGHWKHLGYFRTPEEAHEKYIESVM